MLLKRISPFFNMVASAGWVLSVENIFVFGCNISESISVLVSVWL